ncbi:MAG: erythromycin esterase family protein [Polyangiaceae bacterium]|nr:erythromycin esterase family protein [Polyangiaceae bacterium]
MRDRFLADSVVSLLAREPTARVAILAHNGHVQRTPVVWGTYLSAYPMGSYLAAALGDGYVAIGTTSTGERTSEMALDPSTEVGFRVVDAKLEAPQEGSFEAALQAAGLAGQLTLMPLRGAPPNVFTSLRAQSGYLTTDVTAAYDAIITLPRFTAQRDLGF